MSSRTVLLGGVLLAALALKHHYSVASPDDLRWILAPTTAAVELVTGSSFEYEAGEGYLSREHRFVIAKSCAGVNFLIVALLCSTFSFLGRKATLRERLQLVGLCLAGSYLGAIVANTIRISVALTWNSAYYAHGWFTRERIHRLEGITIYALCLVLFYLAAHRALRRPAVP